MSDTTRNYVSGQWIESATGETIEVENPARPSEVVARYQDSSTEDATEAVEAAADAADDWAATPGPERGRILREAATLLAERKDELTDLLVAEEGKANAEAGGEVQRAIDIFYHFAVKAAERGGTVKNPSSPNQNLYTIEEPVGVAALITPWNYPIAIPAWKLAPALAAGNTVVLKPASAAPGVAMEIARALDEAGLPDGVLNVVTGSGSVVGTEFIERDAVDAVSFTGSSEVGEMVYDQATDSGKRVQTELGGKNPTIVADSADPAEAADLVASGAFGVTGQACTACSRAIVHEDVLDEFVAELVDRAESIDIGPGDEHEMGPQVSESELESTLDYVEVAEAEGATLVSGGGIPEGSAVESGYFVEPTVFTDVDSEMRIAQEEVFGPLVAVIAVSDFDEALAVANDVEYGLAASIVTDDHTEANRFVREAESGVVKVNDKTTGLELHVPFGGFKRSSSETWREQGDEGLDFYTIEKTVYDNY
ncbi:MULTISPECIES: aldehyde dehydrogenase family protein [unclassified Haladaptatus]|uniref:2,5-dioxovalerate dehydrogenase n=1 Tax=unclassified Haladaptatus TaxID=2622732 RepID=UPI00209C2424|nr:MULTISPECIES: aldehyde dehydrogenase family protein [unclassified Haladaptatus]MCO8243722.1 aldehyde dehydrogenase family protein [Haladaptatus sp. AB643]MCO8255131.1 aldehyde dehydrogenase family protein [Haladaptatus sp. AB618]